MREYRDILAKPAPCRSSVAEIAAVPDLVVETADGAFCGAVVEIGRAIESGEKRDTVTLEDRNGRRRVFPMLAASFLLDGTAVTLVRPAPPAPATTGRARTASGSYAVPRAEARVAKANRIWVEGLHDAALLERIWGEDLRVEGIVVESLDGIDDLLDHVREFRPGPHRRIGVLVDHLVEGTKESRLVDGLRRAGFAESVLVTGHPYVDVWQAVKPSALGIDRWPRIARGTDWKTGVCTALGASNPREMWRAVLASVDSFADVEVPLLRAVEELIDFVTTV